MTSALKRRRPVPSRDRSERAIRLLDGFFPPALLGAPADLADVARTVAQARRVRRRGRVKVLRRPDGKRVRAYAIGQAVRELRHKAGLRQEDLAKKAGIARPNIARIERGAHEPSTRTLRRVAEALGVPLARLLDVEDPVAAAADRGADRELDEAGLGDWLAALEEEDRR